MSVSYFVRYDIEVADLDAFVRRYREVHVPLLATRPGLRLLVLHTPIAGRERAAAREDFRKFAGFEGNVFHQAMAQDEVYRAPWLDGNEEGA